MLSLIALISENKRMKRTGRRDSAGKGGLDPELGRAADAGGEDSGAGEGQLTRPRGQGK